MLTLLEVTAYAVSIHKTAKPYLAGMWLNYTWICLPNLRSMTLLKHFDLTLVISSTNWLMWEDKVNMQLNQKEANIKEACKLVITNVVWKYQLSLLHSLHISIKHIWVGQLNRYDFHIITYCNIIVCEYILTSGTFGYSTPLLDVY